MKWTGTIIATGSGSVGGCTFSHNRYGQYVRNRSIPVNTQTAEQQTIRSLFSLFASRWSGILTQAQRDAWDTYALNVGGVSGPRTGLNWYVACNTFRQQVSAGLGIVDAAPTIFALATFTPSVITADDSSNSVVGTFTNTDAWATEVGGALAIYGSLQMSPSRNFFAGPYKFKAVALGAVAPPASPIQYTDTTIVAGNKVGVYLRACRADGRISAVQRALATVIA